MARGDLISVNAKSFLRGANLADQEVRTAVEKAMWENQADLEKEAKALAPVDEGTLMRSGSGRRKARWVGHTLTGEVGFNASYAAKVHELMWPAVGVSLGRSGAMGVGMMPGATTQKKPGTVFGPAGGKYLERPLIGKSIIYTERIGKKIKAVLARKRIRARG